ncbi:oxidoreductase [Sphingomonas immobilis]|uniref:12-oxophytodienoate reductase n=1 Tax=Sphingomonas immobilis TaxID=3063997 RepID=A0ABT8ZX67_9SPHN|nr:12-oxophytodienoate reductase [Sphingomonas sp. CA1-15]MDO7842172.1 12-oxophytodienoate reductase [Sphingomonas sp. CA1-15]
MSDPLFDPLAVGGGVTLPNRLVMSPMTRGFSPDGVPPETAADYYGRRAEGGIGLIVTEGVAVEHPAAIGNSGSGGEDIPEMFGEAALAAWHGIVERVHGAGSIIFPQLWHQGGLRIDDSGRYKGRSPRPSGIWGPETPSPFFAAEYLALATAETEPASEEEIADVIAAFARSAANAMACGFDGIAIHGAHGYLLDTFFWHVTNRRDDGWGGPTLAERARFGAEVVRAIRREIGDAPIMFRFSQWKLHDYGARLAETPEALAALLEPLADAGVDIFDASTRKFATPAFDGSPLGLAAWAQKITGKPAMAVGGVGLADDLQSSLGQSSAVADNVGQARAMVASGEISLVGVGRGLLTNADWASRVRGGEPLRAYDAADYRTRV